VTARPLVVVGALVEVVGCLLADRLFPVTLVVVVFLTGGSGLGQTTGLVGVGGLRSGEYSLRRTSRAVASSMMTTISVVTDKSMVVAVLLFRGMITPLWRSAKTFG
jgi:hypothetical protein